MGWWGVVEETERERFRVAVEAAVGGPVRLVPGGPDRIRSVGIVTGGAGSMVGEAAEAGLDAYVTGEGAHHTFIDAHEERINLCLAGHYATETFGVRALAEHLADHFGLTWEFIDLPSGM